MLCTSLHQRAACTKTFWPLFGDPLTPGTEALELGVASTCGPSSENSEGKLPDRTCVWEQLSLSKEVRKRKKRRRKEHANVNSQVLAQGRLLKRKRVGGSGETSLLISSSDCCLDLNICQFFEKYFLTKTVTPFRSPMGGKVVPAEGGPLPLQLQVGPGDIFAFFRSYPFLTFSPSVFLRFSSVFLS